jgi:signal transduction histidine kinase
MDAGLIISAVAGLVVGAAAAGGIAGVVSRRYVRKVRAAERRARAAERMAEIGGLTGGLAHEIKNPLSTIGLNAQLLAEGIDELEIDDERKGRLTRRIASLRREVERLRGVLADFLNYAGTIKPELGQVDLKRVVEEIGDFFMPQAAQAGVTLRLDLPEAAMEARADAALVKQALLNLMLNAVQAMGGSDGRAKELILRVAEVRDESKRWMRLVHVIDTGPGITPEGLAKVFQPYFTTKAGGSGLGLPTARRLIEAQGGRLDVVSEVGRGTDFVIWLPAWASDAAERGTELGADQSARGAPVAGGR